jgi:hypothetical protein
MEETDSERTLWEVSERNFPETVSNRALLVFCSI